MYIRTASAWGLGQPPATCPRGKNADFSSGGEYIRENAAAKLLALLSGPSCYQKYIQPVLKSQAASTLPRDFLRIVSSPSEVPKHLRGRFTKDGDKIVGGTIDRRTGTIYMIPAPGRRIDNRLEFALHEAVHLFAHPFLAIVDRPTFQKNYGTALFNIEDVGTFQRKYGFGLGEGATQVIAEQILEAQGITTYQENPYAEYTPVVRKLISVFSLDRIARAYFWGQINELTQAMDLHWGQNTWATKVAYLTNLKKPRETVAEIDSLEKAYKKRFEDMIRSGPKGDFPTPSAFRSYV